MKIIHTHRTSIATVRRLFYLSMARTFHPQLTFAQTDIHIGE
jgi:hypothetical protein